MRSPVLLTLCAAVCLPALVQSAAPAQPSELPKDPRAIFAAAAPLYDFTDPALKPWHFKAAYQLYDEKGNPTQQGTYEYWWASPKVYRSTWTRAGASHTDWHTADGKHLYLGTGDRVGFIEYKIESALLSPLPNPATLDPTQVRLEHKAATLGGSKFDCIVVSPLAPRGFQTVEDPIGRFPTWCFDPSVPALRISYSYRSLAMNFNLIVPTQGRYLARGLVFFEGKRQLLTAKVDAVNAIAATDPALVPDPAAHSAQLDKVPVSAGTAVGMLIKKVTPIYPEDAKKKRISGTVVVQASIGTDGIIHDLHVISAPWPSLAAEAIEAVSHWEYKPFMQDGEPVEVEATINVIFTLGR